MLTGLYQARRPVKHRSLFYVLLSAALCTLVGIALGVASRLALHFTLPVLTGITQSFSFWALVTAAFACASRSPLTASLNTLMCFVSMDAAYYLLQRSLYGFIDTTGFLEWLVVGVIVAAASFVIWFGHGVGPIAVACGVWPFLVCTVDLAELLIIYRGELHFTLIELSVSAVCLIVLILILPKTARNRFLMPVLAVAATFFIVVLPFLILH